MFCTCSRICSISTFISTETLVSSSAADLLPSVLASRCSSWIRKSSRLPSSPPAFSRRSISSRCARQARQFLGHVDADRKGGGLVQRALLQGLRRHGALPPAPAGGQGLVPALQKALLLALHHGGTSGSAWRGQFAQARTRSSSIATSLAPSRARASRRPSTQRRAASSAGSSSFRAWRRRGTSAAPR
jgi:hypothetical protein